MMELTPKQLVSFWSRVTKENNCWVWTGYKDKDGYGKFAVHIQGTKYSSNCYSAYRVSFELMKEEIPKGLQLDHLCRNRACVNPDHLEIVTTKQNVLRGIGIPAINSKKTHCPRGHEYNEVNTRRDKNGGRYCRPCCNATQRRYTKRKKEVAHLD